MADFESLLPELQTEQITVLAGSTDPLEETHAFIERLGLTFPIACGLDALEISERTGAYYENEKKFLHPANFLLRPDNTIEVAAYSSGAIGRFAAQDVVKLVRFYKKTARG